MSQNYYDDAVNGHSESYEERVEKLVMLTVGVAKGIIPTGQMTLLLHQIAHGAVAPPEIREFAKVLIQITKGERDPAIGAHLPSDLAEAIKDTIARVEAPLPDAGSEDAAGEELTLLELLQRVGEACLGDIQLWQQLWDFSQTLQEQDTTPPEIKTLAEVIRKILAGERQQHITADLPPQLAEPVNLLLAQLLQHAVSPPD